MISFKNITNLIHTINENQINTIKIKNKNIEILINKIKARQKQNINNNKKKKIQFIDNNITIKTNEIKKNKIEQSIKYAMILSPMVGIFYKSPAPTELPFVKINDIIKPKQIVCIIEAMKLMNEIEAEVNGEIIEILVQDGEIINCGQALMKVKIIK
uniref:Biotin carboxyl carrier protein of acetyl-CoA carboxylase n=1 Tax=Harveyella mirabilis TaxID=282355 RepID=A0A3S8UW12_9FLOR|nr:acetyl-CoA carboxylase, biotin carboxyl carrier protein [Harveyella mirabilis]